MDTAAVMQQLNLIVTVDTAVAHCAGALGVPVWVALPFATRLALAVAARGQSLVSYHAAVPAETLGRLGRSLPTD